jgi:hypothetical protein
LSSKQSRSRCGFFHQHLVNWTPHASLTRRPPRFLTHDRRCPAQMPMDTGGGNSKIFAKIGNSVVEALLKPFQTGEKIREIENRNA